MECRGRGMGSARGGSGKGVVANRPLRCLILMKEKRRKTGASSKYQ